MKLSLVIPVYNESENLPLLHEQILQALSPLADQTWELIFVDDGSTDQSPEVLEKLVQNDPTHTTALLLRRNFGQTAAIAAGIDHASGEVIILMDADMQNDPADIPRMLEMIDQGHDVVSGWRENRQDAFLTRVLPSRIANWLISTVTGVHLHDYGCTLKAYRREVLAGFRLYGEMHRFIPAYAHSVGARIVELPVRHHPRRFGKTKYGLTRTIKVLLDLITVKFLISYSNKPIYPFGGMGIVLILISMGILTFLLVRRVLFRTSVVDSPFFSSSLMVMILGFQSILLGLIAEMQVRTYHESQKKPTYTIRKQLKSAQEAGSIDAHSGHNL
ncbi:MAG: glycosyltransferase [Anaerolineae bacterium UTCFX2]|nr:glycosyltransferase family 2 protein [Anaerolineales bacterium]OQY91859.1 MAG: glycosyltransferase [Anaerolineae bacterium UTCFX2]